MNDQLIAFAKSAILEHLTRNPQSADTLEGIHLWWIVWPDIQESVFVTAEALRQLQDENCIEMRTIGGRELWRLPQR